MAHRTLLILNRKSAPRADVRAAVKAVQKQAGLDVRIPWSKKQLRDELERAVRKGVTRVIAGGGDGTLNDVINAVVRVGVAERVSLGLIPLGTANDFARGFGDMGEDIAASLQHALEGDAKQTDLGTVNGRHFINVASGGFGAMITATTPKDMKRQLGGLAYTLHGLSRLHDLRPHRCRFALDGAQPYEVALSFLAIGNARFAGGGFEVTPEAQLDDGVLDLALLSHDWQGAPGFLIREAFDPTNPENEAMVYRTFRQCVLETDRDFHLNLDGEPISGTRFEIEVTPGALQMVR